jgi:hypothetical protein
VAEAAGWLLVFVVEPQPASSAVSERPARRIGKSLRMAFSCEIGVVVVATVPMRTVRSLTNG